MSMYYYHYFTVKEIEGQRSKITYLRSHSQLEVELCLDPDLLASKTSHNSE